MASSRVQSSKPPSKSYWKGKARATESDYDDLNPTITYRHLLSNNLGVRDPLRVIALCDSDAFYAACEQVRLNIDPNLPLVVLQWDSLIAVNYPARKFDISRMCKVWEAKKKCPNLVVVHVATLREGDTEPGYWENPDTHTHKVSLDHYRRESMKIIQLFKEGLPTGEVEKASIDEAFIDFTRPVREELLKRYPYLATVPPDAPNGLDSPLPPPPPISWEGRGNVISVNPPKEKPPEDKPELSTVAEEDHSIEEDDEQTTWHDVALSIAAELMMRIREDIRTKLGYTTSAGLARNKFLAKLTASYRKPMNQTILRNAAIPNYLRPMPFQKIRFLGGKLGKALAEEYDVSTVGDLLTISLEEMQRKFGENAIWVYEIIRAIDRSEVKEKSAVNKSMLAAKNLPQPVTKSTDGYSWIRILAAELALRLNDARETNPALWPKSIVMGIQQGVSAYYELDLTPRRRFVITGWHTSRSKQTPFPFTKNITADVVMSFGEKLWKELVGPSGSTPFKITHISLSFSGIGMMEAGQRTIEGFLTSRNSSDDQFVSAISEGSKSPRKRPRSPSASSGKPESKGRQLHSRQDHAGSSSRAVFVDDGRSEQPTEKETYGEQFSFICEKCHKRIWLPDAPRSAPVASVIYDVDSSVSTGGADGGGAGGPILPDAIREDALAALRLEHADLHFAQELAAVVDEGAPKRVIRPPASTAAKKKSTKKSKSANEGIAKFFQRK